MLFREHPEDFGGAQRNPPTSAVTSSMLAESILPRALAKLVISRSCSRSASSDIGNRACSATSRTRRASLSPSSSLKPAESHFRCASSLEECW